MGEITGTVTEGCDDPDFVPTFRYTFHCPLLVSLRNDSSEEERLEAPRSVAVVFVKEEEDKPACPPNDYMDPPSPPKESLLKVPGWAGSEDFPGS